MRTARSLPVQDADRGTKRSVRLHRGLLQSATPSLIDRIPLTVEYEHRHHAAATHTSLPPCSRPSRTSPSGGRRKRPSLTATARGSRVSARVGTEEWRRRGPNQRMPRTGGSHDVKPESLIPRSHLSTKPG